MKKLIALAGLGLAAAAAHAQDPAAKPKIAGFDIAALDRSASACTDFYQFACGGWMKANPVPADRARWGRFDELQDRNRDVLRDILNQISASSGGRTPVDQRIGDHYAACMDESGTEAKGAKPLDADLAAIAAIADKAALTDRVARLQMSGTAALFGYGSLQDFKDATKVLAVVDQGGLGLPDRDYYLKDDARSVELRTKYVAHVQKMLELLGDKPEAAAASAKTIMAMETALAKVSLERVKRRDPENLYHKMSRADLATLAPEIRVGGVLHVDERARVHRDQRHRTRSSSRRLSDARQDAAARRLEDLPALAPGAPAGAAARRRPSSTRTSTSTGRRSRAPRSCGRAGSAASTASTRPGRGARPGATSRRRSARRARSAWPRWCAALEKALEQRHPRRSPG